MLFSPKVLECPGVVYVCFECMSLCCVYKALKMKQVFVFVVAMPFKSNVMRVFCGFCDGLAKSLGPLENLCTGRTKVNLSNKWSSRKHEICHS